MACFHRELLEGSCSCKFTQCLWLISRYGGWGEQLWQGLHSLNIHHLVLSRKGLPNPGLRQSSVVIKTQVLITCLLVQTLLLLSLRAGSGLLRMARELKPPQAMLACGTNSSATKQSPGVFSPPHIQPGKQNQGSVVGNRTLSTFKTTERKLKTKKTFTYSHEVQIHRDRMQNGGCHRLGGRGKGKWCLMSTEFWFCKLKKFWRLHNKGNILNPTEVHT